MDAVQEHRAGVRTRRDARKREAPVAKNATFSGPKTGLHLKNNKLPFTHPVYVDKQLESIKIIPAICLIVVKHTLSHTFFFLIQKKLKDFLGYHSRYKNQCVNCL